MPRFIATSLIVLLVTACATRPDGRLSLPLSERTDFIHAYEAINFVPLDRGEKDNILYFKSAPPEVLRRYRRFDTHVILQERVVYQSINKHQAVQQMADYIRERLIARHFLPTAKGHSQAGIVATVSTYQKSVGKNIEELMVVVYDRGRLVNEAWEGGGPQGLDLLKAAAIWVGVVRQQPEKQVDISQETHHMSQESFQGMVDSLFEVFMKDSQFIPLD